MKKKSGTPKKLFADLLLTSLIFCLMIILSYQNSWDFLNWKFFDTLMNIRRNTPEKRDNVVIVCIDQKSLEYVMKNNGHSWPWPREYHAQLVRYLSQSGAKAILFDVIFSEPDIDRTNASPGEVCDADLGEAIEESGITYLSAALQKGIVNENPFEEKIFLPENNTFNKLRLDNQDTAVFPLTILSKGAAGLGFTDCIPEDDGIVRRYPLVFKFDGKYVSSAGFDIARDFIDEKIFNDNILSYFGKNTLIDEEGKTLLNWYGRGGPDGVFTYYSYHAVLVSSILEERNKSSLFPPDTFNDKIVIIGSNAPGLFDLKPTPFTHEELYPGFEIHATAIENFLSNDFIYRIPWWIIVVAMSVSAILLFFINNAYQNLRLYVSVFFVLLFSEILISYLIISNNMWISAVDIISTTTFIFAGLIIAGYFSESKDVRLLRKQFERYVSDTVLEEILVNPSSVDLEGKTLYGTVMATDIADFTSISEKLPPREVVSRLNDYLSEVSEVLIDNRAFINKYIGDAILAIYGTFDELDHKRNACMSAINALKIINKKIEHAHLEKQTPLITRFGITSGEITMGNIGSARKTEYTVIGDAVNSAFRLEGLNKFYNTTILVSEYTKEGAGDDFEFRWLDVLRYKGKVTPVHIYELIGLKGEVDNEKLRIRDEFEEALRLYHKKEFKEAENIFARLLEDGDKPSEVFKKRCEEFIQSPPPPDWAGVWVMLRK